MNLQFSPEVLSSLGVPQIVDWRRSLPVNKNYTWAQLTKGPRDINDITVVALHHDAISKQVSSNRDDLTLATNISTTHINSKANEPKGDASFPYHLWIRNGIVYYCNNLEDMTYGVSSKNTFTVHVCVSGDYFNYDALTERDRNALYAVILTLPSVLPAYKDYKPHDELDATNCPGYDMIRVRNDVLTWKNKLAFLQTAEYAKERAYKIANQILYFYNLANGKNPDGTASSPGNVEWGKSVLLELDPFMTEKGLL